MSTSVRTLVRLVPLKARQQARQLPYRLASRAFAGRIDSPYPPIEAVRVPLPDMVMQHWPRYVAEGRVAVTDDSGASRTFAEMDHSVPRIAGALRAAGIGVGDVVACVSPNHVDFGALALAVARLGAVLTPANPAYTAVEVRAQIEGSGAKAVVAHPSTVESVLGAVRGLGAARTVACFGGRDALPAAAAAAGVACVDEWRAGALRVDLTAAGVSPRSLAVLPFSSGTTGLPKGTCLSHANLCANLLQFMAPEGRFIPEGAAVICPLPQYHIYAFTLAVLFMLWRGHPLVTQARFDLRRFCAQVEAHRPARAYLVPPILLALAKEACVDEYDFSSLVMISSAAAPLDAELEKACARRLGCGVKQAWGMSELSPLGTWPADTELGPGKVGSVGPPVPSTSVRIVALAADEAAPAAADALVDVPRGLEGELLVSGPQVMGGYLNMPEATARTLWTDPADGRVWLRTGDVARVDADRFVFITDRAKELIKVKGFQVAPAELEAVLLTHPLVLDAAVIPVADEASGELPRAYVVLRPPAAGAPRADPAAEANLIADFVAGVVAPHKRLRGGVVITDSIPKSAAGKILRRLIRDKDRAQQHAQQHHEHAPRERA